MIISSYGLCFVEYDFTICGDYFEKSEIFHSILPALNSLSVVYAWGKIKGANERKARKVS